MNSKQIVPLLLLFLLPLSFYCDIGEPDMDIDEPPTFSNEDDYFINLLDKYDEDHQGFYTKENYKRLLVELLLESPGTEDIVSDVERIIITQIVNKYVDKLGKEQFTYQEVVTALETEEVMNALSSGLQNSGDELLKANEEKKKAKVEKLKKKEEKKLKKEEKKKNKKNKDKKGKKKNKKTESCRNEAVDDPNGQCLLPETNQQTTTIGQEEEVIKQEEVVVIKQEQEREEDPKKQDEL